MRSLDARKERFVVKSWQEGDESYYDWIFNKYYRVNFSYVYSMTKDRMISEEIAMDVMFVIWKRKMLINSEVPILCLMYKTAKNRVIDYNRSRRVSIVGIEAIEDKYETGVEYESDHLAIKNELRGIYRNVMESLSPKRRRAFYLSRELGLSYGEIAEKMGVSRNTVENHIALALKDFRQRLPETGIAP